MSTIVTELQEIKHELKERKVYHSPWQLRALRKRYKLLKHKIITTNTTTTKPNQLKLL